MAADLFHTVTRNGSVTATVPRFDIIVTAKNPKTGATIKTITTTFPAFLNQFTVAQQEELLQDLIYKAEQIWANQ